MRHCGKNYNDDDRYEKINQNRFLGINGRIKEQLHNEHTIEPNQSQHLHDIVTCTVVSKENDITTDISVKDSLTKNNDEDSMKSVSVRRSKRTRLPVVRLSYEERGVILQQ